MAVTYMLKLEDDPKTYDKEFSRLTKGVSSEVFNWISENALNFAKDSQKEKISILEVGCGPGLLSKNMAQHGFRVVGIDSNSEMIEFANNSIKDDPKVLRDLEFRLGNATNFYREDTRFDIIISTFMLSELRPLQQLMFLQQAWKSLKPNGKLFIAEEFYPTGVAKLFFNIKKWWYRTKTRKEGKGVTHPLKWLDNALDSGFTIIKRRSWQSNSIRAIYLQKDVNSDPTGYVVKTPDVWGLGARIKELRCFLTGQIDKIGVEPGLYGIGKPNKDSPVIVTANYILTFNRVVRSIANIDCWLLVVDTNAINVWCAARGGEFENLQLMEAVNATGLINKVKHRTLILPQLSAGGVGAYEFPSGFEFKIKFGPVWAKSIEKYLSEKLKRKPLEMRLAKFTAEKRFEAGVSHVTFILRKFLLKPTIILSIILLLLNLREELVIIGEVWLWIAVVGMVIAMLYPLTQFSRKFVIKGYFYIVIESLLLLLYLNYRRMYNPQYILTSNPIVYLGILIMGAWLAIFLTMSFSGYTMETSYREINAEYPLFKKVHKRILTIGAIFTVAGFIMAYI